MFNKVIRLFSGDGRYRVTVDGVGIHCSRHHRKAFSTYEAECEFAKIFSRPCCIELIKLGDPDIVIEQFNYRGRKHGTNTN